MNAKDLTNEELAIILRCMRITGLATTSFEKECLDEAADRMELFTLTMEERKHVERN